MASNYLDDLVLAYLWLIVLRDRDLEKAVQIMRWFQEHPDELYSKL